MLKMQMLFGARRWMWLYPATYAVHIVEELTGGPGFAAWFNAQTGARFSTLQLVVLNAVGMVAMIGGLMLVFHSLRWRWITTTLAAIVAINAVMHLVATWVTRSYSPGMVSGLTLWLPLGTATLIGEWRSALRSTFVKGLIAAAVFHLLMVGTFFVV